MSQDLETIAYATAEEFIESLHPEAAPFRDWDPREWAFRGQPEDKDLKASAFRPNQEFFRVSDDVWEGWTNYQQISAEIEVTVDFFEAADASGLVLPDDSPQLRDSLSKFRRASSDRPPNELLREWPPRDLWSLVALMQHAGVPTRFLDWSASPYKAAYFAARCGVESGSDIAVVSYLTSWQRFL